MTEPSRRLRRFLLRRGATHADIERAAREEWLSLLAFDKILMPGRPRFTQEQIARRADVDPSDAGRIWRALGFPDVPPDMPIFNDEDVRALRTLEHRLGSPVMAELVDPIDPLNSLVQQVRVIGAALARIAEVLTDTIVSTVEIARSEGVSDAEFAELALGGLDWRALAELNDYALRLQVRAALWRRLAGDDPTRTGSTALAVGFVDMVGYTALSQELDDEELAALVTRFEALAYDTVAVHGGRLVKTIGDEVMFVADDPAAVVEIALLLTEHSADDESLPEAKAGTAFGPVLAREGDYYGPVVNLASRLVGLARPGTVVVSDPLHEAVESDDGLEWRKLRNRRIRDIGSVAMWHVRRAPAVAR